LRRQKELLLILISTQRLLGGLGQTERRKSNRRRGSRDTGTARCCWCGMPLLLKVVVLVVFVVNNWRRARGQVNPGVTDRNLISVLSQ
jgi:hypothetical protein